MMPSDHPATTQALFRVVSAIPGRIRIRYAPCCARRGCAEALARLLRELPYAGDVETNGSTGSVLLRYRPDSHPLELAVCEAGTLAGAACRQVRSATNPGLLSRRAQVAESREPGVDISGQIHIHTAVDMPSDRGPGFRPLAVPSVAVALSALEILPAALIGAAFAMAALPVAGRAAAGLRSRRLTTDQLDLLNLLILFLGGELLVASVVSWLITLGEVLRANSIREARAEIARLAGTASAEDPSGDELGYVLNVIRSAPLDESAYQQRVQNAARHIAAPSAVAAGLAYLITRDPSAPIGILKPQADFAFGFGFSGPAAALNSMAAHTRGGPLFSGIRAIERVASIDAFVLRRDIDPEPLAELVTELAELGISRFVLRTERQVQAAKRALSRTELRRIIVQRDVEGGEELLKRLYRQGYRAAVSCSGPNGEPDLRWAWVRISADARDAQERQSELLLPDGDPTRIPAAIRHARATMQVLRQNSAIAAGSSGINLASALLWRMPAPVPTLINTCSIALQARNARRPLDPGSAPGSTRLA
jgi:cation transport ATPase